MYVRDLYTAKCMRVNSLYASLPSSIYGEVSQVRRPSSPFKTEWHRAEAASSKTVSRARPRYDMIY
jgi:hypothetical protein